MPESAWSAPVRFAEVDQQGVVFNSHYLTYCDEAFAAFLAQRSTAVLDLVAFSARVRLVTSTLTWIRAATWGDLVDVEVRCERIGATSLSVSFAVRVGDQACCDVTTTYVLVDERGAPVPLPDAVRAALVSAQ